MATSLNIAQLPVGTNDPGFLFRLSLSGKNYKVFAYFEDAQGIKTSLPSTLDAQTKQKIQGLASNLFNAHEYYHPSLNEQQVQILDAQGLHKPDNTFMAHDFTIVSLAKPDFTEQVEKSLTQVGHQMQASAIKAQDIWDAIENLVSKPTSNPHVSPLTLPAIPILPPSATVIAPPVIANNLPLVTVTPPPAAAINPPPLTATPPLALNPAAQIPLSAPIPVRTRRSFITSAELDTQGVDFSKSDWYDTIADRVKLRIIIDILKCRRPGRGGIYENVWNYFKDKPATFVTGKLELERDRLIDICQTLPSQIPSDIRREAINIIDAYYSTYYRPVPPNQLEKGRFQSKINEFFQKEFICKEELRERLRAHTLAQEALPNCHLLVEVLAGWLDNN